MFCFTQASDLEPSSETLTELKPVKQSVTYDNQTGKVMMMMMIMMTMMIMMMMIIMMMIMMMMIMMIMMIMMMDIMMMISLLLWPHRIAG